MLGAAGGLLIATWCVDGLLLLAPPTLPRREVIGVDAIAALFAVGAALVCAIAASLVPAWQATRTNAVAALKQDPALRAARRRFAGCWPPVSWRCRWCC